MLNGCGADMDVWDRVGRRLAAVDPSRFESVLELAVLTVLLHEDPASVTPEAESCVPPEAPDDPDEPT